MYYMLLYKSNFLGVFTSFLNAKKYIDYNFEFDFIDDGENYKPLNDCIFNYYYDWEIKPIETAYKKSSIPCISIACIKKIDNLYIYNHILIRCTIRNNTIIDCSKIDSDVMAMSYKDIKDLEYILFAEIKVDLKLLVSQIENCDIINR